MSKVYLLTGAGFTKNFGGFLASEMWARIYNHPKIQSSSLLRNQLLEDQDFESIYHKIYESDDTIQTDTITEAILDAYKMMDEIIADFTFSLGSPYPVNIYKVQSLVEAFKGELDDPGFVFTLNQDLFLETLL